MTRVNWLAGDVKLKGRIFKRAKLKAPGYGLAKGKVITTGSEYNEVEFSYALQTAADPFKALAIAGTEGTTGTSYYFQVNIPSPTAETVTTYTVYGAQLLSYKVSSSTDSDTPPIVTVKWTCYDITSDAGVTQTDAIPSGAINEWDDMVVTLDGDQIVEMKSFDLTITNSYFMAGSGRNASFNRFKPLLTAKELELTVNFYLDSAALLSDTITEALNTFTVAWTDGTNTIGSTLNYVESDNFLEYAGDKIDGVEYNMTIKSGDTVFS